MKPLPEYLRATAFEYKHRFLIHGLIYTLGLAAPWHLPLWSFLHNESCWFLIADAASKPTFANFAPVWNEVCAGLVLFAVAGVALRVWGAAYLGAATVHSGGMDGSGVIAAGPYRYLRNPLYLGTLLHSVAIVMLMRPEAAVLTMILLTVLQLRLIGREEPFLLNRQGVAYAAYCDRVPRLLPRLRSGVSSSGYRPNWAQGFLSEVYMLGVAVTFAVFGWTRGYAWDLSLIRVVQGIVIALGLSVVAQAFIPKAASQQASEPATQR
ncbi:methyltransferase family protein [Terriglobus aquaticus]|uniref:Methyltransferase family protein n=1 Tax=Terriglobus aquaticus TaxID=940139 RepID=A0ABW9KGI5_9BACT|nr:isoprenylcysteine carboxylmethyltransferase family protein [Terriglobus aquaticus]